LGVKWDSSEYLKGSQGGTKHPNGQVIPYQIGPLPKLRVWGPALGPLFLG